MDTEKKSEKSPEPTQDIGKIVGDLVVSGATILAHSAAEAVVKRVNKATADSAPVQAVAKGTVTFAGWEAGYGNLVRIKHAGGLSTGYAHLSRIAAGVRVGTTVDQGELIGSVGQTGLATGPHLHYMMAKNGKVINPMTMKAEPPIPIDAKLLPKFEEYIAPLAARFEN